MQLNSILIALASSILVIVTSGCIGPLVPVVDLDYESTVKIREAVKVYTPEDIQGIQYKRLGIVEGVSCMNKIWDPPATREDAIDQLRYRSLALGGNGVATVICGGTEGTNLAKNCWTSVTCHATAVQIYTTGHQNAMASSTQEPRISSAGSGFVVSRQGHLLTNNHVVAQCKEIQVTIAGRSYKANAIRQDRQNDLALLVTDPTPTGPLSFSSRGRIRTGDNVIALGFPLSGILSPEPHATVGTLTALSGIDGDVRYLEISAPVQPGNSGGPLLDATGAVVGVIVSKLNAAKVATLTGDIPQNINFAINARIATAFLEANDISYDAAQSSTIRSTPDVIEDAKGATAYIECRR
jgi:S1-C subfamily serine protease